LKKLAVSKPGIKELTEEEKKEEEIFKEIESLFV
jgi:hypothetical protein